MPITFTRKTWVDYQEGPFLEAAELNRFESVIDALVNGTSRAVCLDGDTMTGGLTLSAGDLNVAAGVVKTGGTQRISNTGRIDATSIYNVGLTSGRVVTVGAGGVLQDDAGLTYIQTSGVTRNLSVGDYAVAGAVTIGLRQTSGQDAYFVLSDDAQNRRWTMGIQAGSVQWRLGQWTNSGTKIDDPITVDVGAGGAISLGGAGATKRDVNCTGNLKVGGTQRISSTGAATMTSLSSTDQAGTGERLVSASAAGAQSATIAVSAFAKTILDDADAAAVRATIGAAADAGNISHAPLFTGRRTVNCPNGVETAVTPAYTLPANWWQTGKRLRVELCLFAAHNATVLAYIGSRYFATFSVVGPFRGKIVAELVCQSTGASGRFAFLGWTEVASTSGYGATYHAMNSPLFGDSQASADGIGDNWTIDTTASADVVVKIASSYGENIPMPYGSVSIYNP